MIFIDQYTPCSAFDVYVLSRISCFTIFVEHLTFGRSWAFGAVGVLEDVGPAGDDGLHHAGVVIGQQNRRLLGACGHKIVGTIRLAELPQK